MSKQDIIDYKEFEEEVRQNLEAQYNHYMMCGDGFNAHEAVKKMMEYKVISRDDPRCKIGTKMFGDVDTTDVGNYAQFDYRKNRGYDYIPRYLFRNLRFNLVFKCDTIPHWGKRVEGNYSGDIKIGSTQIAVRMQLISVPKAAANAITEMGEIFNKHGQNIGDVNEMIEEAKAGVVRIYELNIEGNTLSKFRTLGYVFTKLSGNGCMAAGMVLKYEAIYSNWIGIEDFQNHVASAIKSCIGDDTMISNMINNKEAISHQNSMIGNVKIQDDLNEKSLARSEALRRNKEEAVKAEKARRDAAMEAKRAARAAKAVS